MSWDELIYLIFEFGILNNFCASINSKILFIKVAESIVIFFPIFHLGCFKACFGLTFLN